MAVLVVAGIADQGLGKRELKGFWDDLLNNVVTTVTPVVDQAVQQIGLTLTQILLQISQGKRDAKGLMDFLNQNIIQRKLYLFIFILFLKISVYLNLF